MTASDDAMKCDQKPPCEGKPFARMFWPGDKARILCFDHALKAQGIAQALGIHLVVEEIHNRD